MKASSLYIVSYSIKKDNSIIWLINSGFLENKDTKFKHYLDI